MGCDRCKKEETCKILPALQIDILYAMERQIDSLPSFNKKRRRRIMKQVAMVILEDCLHFKGEPQEETVIMEDGHVEKMWLSGERAINSQQKGVIIPDPSNAEDNPPKTTIDD